MFAHERLDSVTDGFRRANAFKEFISRFDTSAIVSMRGDFGISLIVGDMLGVSSLAEVVHHCGQNNHGAVLWVETCGVSEFGGFVCCHA